MKRFHLTLLAALAMVACTQPNMDEAPEGQKTSTKIINTSECAIKGSLLVKLNSYTTEFSVESIDGIDIEARPLFPAGNTSEERLHSEDIYRWWELSFSQSANLDNIAEVVATNSLVKHVEFNKIMEYVGDDIVSEPAELHATTRATSDDVPFNDEYLCEQWHFYNDGKLYDGEIYGKTIHQAGADINVFPAWKYCTGDPRVIVAVLDGGVKHSHPDLAANMWVNDDEIAGNGKDDDGNGYIDDVHGFNFNDYNGTIYFDDHGTHVAGTIAAVSNNGVGVAGVAGGSGEGDGCRIMTCQIYQNGSVVTASRIAEAMRYAADNGAVIMNNSWAYSKGAYTSDSQFAASYSVLLDAISYFENNAKLEGVIDGGIALFAAGNDGYGVPSYPGAYYKNICVTAFTCDYTAGTYSNYGTGANICAPGGESSGWYEKVVSTSVSNNYDYMYGTSMATPHVSGCAALGLSYALKIGKSFTRDEFKNIILTSVHDIDKYQTGTKGYYAGQAGYVTIDLARYKGLLGAGYIDAHRVLMNVEGTPCIYLAKGEQKSISLDNYFGDSSEGLTYTNIEIDNMSAIGLNATPTITNGTITLKCTKAGTARMRVTAIIGGTSVGGGNNMGGMEVTREAEIVVRRSVASNGAWL